MVRKVHDFGSGHFQTYSGVEEKMQGQIKKSTTEQNLNVLALVAGAWTEREKMYHGGSFLKLADDNMDIQNPEDQNRAISEF